MFGRYAAAGATGALITFSLVSWMQAMIAGGEIDVEPAAARPVFLAARIAEAPPPKPPRTPPKPPDPIEAPPSLTVPSQLVESVVPAGPARSTLTFPPGRHFIDGVPGTGPAGPSVHSGNGDYLARAQVRPIYPHIAEVRGIEGHVVVEFTISRQGTVRDARIVESSDAVFHKAALQAVARFRYEPRIVNEIPVEVMGVMTRFSFTLNE